MNKFILYNGPKKAGKDTSLDYLKSKGVPLQRLECKDHLHKLTRLFFNVPEDTYWEVYNDRDLKEVPMRYFRLEEVEYYKLFDYFITKQDYRVFQELEKVHPEYWISIRQAMIYVSEHLCKPAFGEDYFGKVRADSIRQGLYVDGSCGFKEELPPLIEKTGQENILLLRVYRDGCTFEGDSRSFIPDGIIDNTIDVYNNGEEEDFLKVVEGHVNYFIGNS